MVSWALGPNDEEAPVPTGASSSPPRMPGAGRDLGGRALLQTSGGLRWGPSCRGGSLPGLVVRAFSTLRKPGWQPGTVGDKALQADRLNPTLLQCSPEGGACPRICNSAESRTV